MAERLFHLDMLCFHFTFFTVTGAAGFESTAQIALRVIVCNTWNKKRYNWLASLFGSKMSLCVAVIVVLAALLFAIFLRILPRICYHDTVASIQQLLRPEHSLALLLSARARPNRRLIRAFELTNTFVSGDERVHSTFRGEAEVLISRANDWHRFRRVADHAVSDALPAPHASCRFDTFVQAVTLQTILLGLLCVDAPDDTRLDATALHTVSALVTELWALSKQPGALDPGRLSVLREHVDALLRSTGRTTLDAFPNPLDIIIPSWETLWRVVATTLAHVHDDADYRKVMHELFVASHTAQSFRRPLHMGGVSAEGIVLESMRLHPPSKHIGRSQVWLLPGWIYSRLPFAVARLFEVVHVADVYAVQTASVYWGASVDRFDPGRQRHDGHAFMAFGYGRLSCVARTWAPIAAALVVASVLEQVDDASFHIRAGKEIGGRHGWEDWHVYAADNSSKVR